MTSHLSAAGRLTALGPRDARAWIANFPGYTGDATSHRAFIEAANALGLGVLCVDPVWGPSTGAMCAHAEALSRELPAVGLLPEQITGIRAVSYGAQLCLSWLGPHVRQLALVTPCSSRLLVEAGRRMDLNVVDDDPTQARTTQAQVRILELARDVVVPHTDTEFLSLSPSTERMTLPGLNHFEAGDSKAASQDVAQWFAGGGR